MATPLHVAIRDLSFSYDSNPEPVFCGLSTHFSRGFTGIIGPNGGGKTTLLQLLAGILEPDAGAIEGTSTAVYCEQRTDRPPAGFEEFLQDWEGHAAGLRSRLGIDYSFLERWPALSHGERKRAQIAEALWQEPELLAIDEPTNHIDSHARSVLIESLQSFPGIGIIVSHDRQLLDQLCHHCLWVDAPNAQLHSGGYSDVREQRAMDRDTRQRERAKIQSAQKRLQAEENKRRLVAASEQHRRSKRGLAAKDSDGRDRINAAINTDGKSGGALRQLSGRMARITSRLDQNRVDKVYETGVWLPGSVSNRSHVLDLPAGQRALDERRALKWPDLRVGVTDRIALQGPNGHGKSTLLKHLQPTLNVPQDRVIYLPQEITQKESEAVLNQIRTLPKDQRGYLMTIVSRLGSRPARLLDSRVPSPGETRKLLLALGMLKSPHVIIMDEPTNHLDIVSIDALETALMDCPCALMLVSHDVAFVKALHMQRWTFRETRPDLIEVESGEPFT